MTATGAQRAKLTWNLLDRGPEDILLRADGSTAVTWDWAVGGATGAGARVCLIDSGIDPDHPAVGPVQGWYAAVPGPDGDTEIAPAEPGDACGHGTACAGVIRAVARECELVSVRVLGRMSGTGDALLAGLRWAVRQGFDVINLSLSTTHRRFVDALHELVDEAYFGSTLLVASAHNLAVESFPWRFSSVLSVGSHAEPLPDLILYNPTPPVEFFAHGVEVEVAWPGGGTSRCSGNSFATPHVTGYCALIRSKHRRLTPFQVRTVLYLTAANVRGDT
jgi:subtilisin family serine protease